MTLATSGSGSGDAIVREDDSLTLVEERVLVSPENPGYVIDDTPGSDQWESTVSWDTDATSGASDWRTLLQKNRSNIRSNVAVEVARGDLSIDLVAQNSLLTLASGYLRTLQAGKNITLTADDINFISGVGYVVGLNELRMQAHQAVWNYYLGTTAETAGGVDYEENSTQQTSLPGFYFSNRDLAALANGYTQIRVGRAAVGNHMYLGDIKDTTLVKKTGETRLANSKTSALHDATTLTADVIDVVGDVQAPLDLLTLNARKLWVQSQNIQDPVGGPDSGLFARQVLLNVGEQALVGGWVKGTEKVTLNVTGTPGDAHVSGSASDGTDAYFVPPYLALAGANSLQIDSGGLIASLGAASTIAIETLHSIETRGKISVGGIGSTLNLHAGGPIIVAEGTDISGLAANATLNIRSDDVIAINPGSALRSGVAFQSDNITPYISGANGALNIVSSGELLLGGSVSASGDMLLSSSAQKYDGQAYGDATNAAYAARYAIFNKSAYFANIAKVSQTHYLVAHTGGYGMLVTGTVTSLGDSKSLTLHSDQDVIVRGNINATGAAATLTLQSNEWL
ncbi:MAG: hypothetical protein ACR2I0_01850, partial [Rhodoferax sp.]